MNASSPSAAIVFGVGAVQGIGAAVSRRIARQGLTVHIAGRTQSKLDEVVADIQATGGTAIAHVLDATNSDQVAALFATVSTAGLPLALVVNNVGSNMPARFLHSKAKFVDQMWRLTFLSGFLVSLHALPILRAQGHGTLLFTGASASIRGKPMFAAFTTGKASLRAYVYAIAAEAAADNIHIGHIVIDGMVDGDRINNFGGGTGRVLRYAMKGKGGALNIDAIADTYWQIHTQPRGLWTIETDLRPFKEKF
jgi:short-subunit dehydrogenase